LAFSVGVHVKRLLVVQSTATVEALPFETIHLY